MLPPTPYAGAPGPGAASAPAPAEAPALRAAFGQFRRLTLLMRPFWGLLMKGMVIGLVVGMMGLAMPWFTKLLVDEVYPSRNPSLLTLLVAGALTMGATSMVLSGIQSYYNLTVNTRLNNAAGLLFFNHLQHLPMRFFEEHRVGELTSRFGDVRRALQSVARAFQTLFVQGVYLIFVPPFLFFLHWKLALIAMVSIPLTTTVIALSGRALRKQWKRSSEAYAELAAFQNEALTQVRTLKSMALEGHTFRRTRDKLTHAMDMELRAGALGQVVGTTNGLLSTFNTALFTWLGWRFILDGSMTLGDYIAFTAYIGYLYGPINQFVGLFSEFQQSAVNLDRMFEYLDTEPEQNPERAYDDEPPIGHRIAAGEVALERVSFSYAPGKRALDEVSLRMAPGSVTAVVGPSGSGKTSLLRLLTRVERPEAGRVLIDGTSVSAIPVNDLRRQVSVVWQEYSLFTGTVWENLTMGMGDVDPETVYRACRHAQVDEFIRTLPKGYQTTVAEAGMSLSGGQRQRIAIARALVRGAPVLLLDEATANVDMETEAKILEALVREYRDRTIVFVTHRVSMARHADQVCMLEAGRVAGLGTHDELLRDCAAYQRLQGSPVTASTAPAASNGAAPAPASNGAGTIVADPTSNGAGSRISNGAEPIVAAPATNGAGSIIATPVSNGTEPVIAAPVSNGAGPIIAAPASNGAGPIIAAPVSNGAGSIAAAPVSDDAEPIIAAPVSNGAGPIIAAPVSNGTEPVIAAPVSNGAGPIIAAPVSNGAGPVVAVSTGQAPAVPLPASSISSS